MTDEQPKEINLHIVFALLLICLANEILSLNALIS